MIDYTTDDLIGESCSFLNINEMDLFSTSRKRTLVDSRHLVIYLLRDIFEFNPDNDGYYKSKTKCHVLAKKFNKRKHNSITHSVVTAKNLIQSDKDFKMKFNNLKAHLLILGYKEQRND